MWIACIFPQRAGIRRKRPCRGISHAGGVATRRRECRRTPRAHRRVRPSAGRRPRHGRSGRRPPARVPPRPPRRGRGNGARPA